MQDDLFITGVEAIELRDEISELLVCVPKNAGNETQNSLCCTDWTQRFFDLVHEHAMSDWRFYGSRAGTEWFGDLLRAAKQIQSSRWKGYALWLIGELEKAAERRDAHRMTGLFLNAFDNQMRLIWA